MAYREKIAFMIPFLSNQEVKLVENMVESAIRYCATVTTMEAKLEILPFRCEPEELKEEVMKLDRNRKLAHDAFISRLSSVNRLYKKNNSLFYEGEDDRGSIGDCAFTIHEEYDTIRKLFTAADEQNNSQLSQHSTNPDHVPTRGKPGPRL